MSNEQLRVPAIPDEAQMFDADLQPMHAGSITRVEQEPSAALPTETDQPRNAIEDQERQRPNYTSAYIGYAAGRSTIQMPRIRTGSPFQEPSSYSPRVDQTRTLTAHGRGQMTVGRPGGGFVGYRL